MRWILGLVGALLGSVVGDEEGLLVGALTGLLVGWLVERERARIKLLAETRPGAASVAGSPPSTTQRMDPQLLALTRRVEQLERQVAQLHAAQQTNPAPVPPGAADSAAVSIPVRPELDDRGVPYEPPVTAPLSFRERYEEQEERAAAERVATGSEAPVDVPRPEARAASSRPLAPPPAAAPSALVEALRGFFLGGNTVVRVGILVLTIGVGLLVKYAADADLFPLELRLALAAAIGMGLVAFGFMQRTTRPAFGTALQGGGVAAMYLVTFFAYYAYQLLPGSLTMALLIAIAALSSVLAVVQNAQQLAVFGAIGGFLSPVLASSGGGSHIALFSYYALLNLAIAGTAIFRSWRILNWTGFLFTFGIASAWGALQYNADNMLSASLFLLLFFLLYVLDGTLFALRGLRRQQVEAPLSSADASMQRGNIDTTLTFGTPLATLALAGGLFHEEHLYLALSCVLIASVYIGLATALTLMRDAALATLARAYIAIGIGVATLSVPFALDDALGTALAWSAEAAGLVWVGSKQQRLRTRVAGYALFLAALFSLAMRHDEASLSGRALFCALIALALALAAAFVERHRESLYRAERYVGHVLFTLSLCVWSAAVEALVERTAPLELRSAAWLCAVAITTLMLELLGARFLFRAARTVSTFAFPFLLLGSLELLGATEGPFSHLGWLGFALAITAAYVALHRNEATLRAAPVRTDLMHASAAWLLAILLFSEASHLTTRVLSLDSGWTAAACLLAPLLVVGLALARRPAWPVAVHPRAYLTWSAWPLALVAVLASLLVHGESDGSAAPLPYLPLLNPIDLVEALLIAMLLLLARDPAVRSPRTRSIASWSGAILAFIALNATVVRTAHHWLALPFVAWQVPDAPVVQASFSILWSTLALIAMLVAHRRATREVWVAGAVLLAAVVVKLFLVDLSSLGGVAKIVTFLAVGLLLLLIGYFAPVPPARATHKPLSDPRMPEEAP